MKILLSILFLIATVGVAQAQIGATLESHARINSSPNGRLTNVGLGLGVDYRLPNYAKPVKLAVDTSGGDGALTRSFANATFSLPTFKESTFALGGGIYAFGSQRAAFGQLDAAYERYSARVRAGAHEMVDVRAGVRVFETGALSVEPFLRFSHFDVNRSNINLYVAGLTLRLGK